MLKKRIRRKMFTRKEFFSTLPKGVLRLFAKIESFFDEMVSEIDIESDGKLLGRAIGQFQEAYFKEIDKLKINKEEAMRNYYLFFHRPVKRLFRWLEASKHKIKD